MNEETYTITDKGRALLAYVEAQKEAVHLGMAEDFGEALDTFERSIYAPIERHVLTELTLETVEEAVEEVCEDPDEPTFEELDKVALRIGATFLEAYALLAAEEADDA